MRNDTILLTERSEVKPVLERLKKRAKALKTEITALYYAGRNPATPLFAKMLVVVTVAYALSPIDLIPDFIPVLGYLDDLIILPCLILLAIKMIPNEILSESRTLAEQQPLLLPRNWVAATIFIFIWLGLAVLLVYAAVKQKW